MNLDTLRELCEARKGDIFSMWKAYCDESGIAEEQYCVVAGFCADIETWDRFNCLWCNILGKYGIDVFHALDFWDRKDGRLQGRYEGWSTSKADSFIVELVEAIKSTKLAGFGAAFDRTDFLGLTEDERRWLTAGKGYGKDWSNQGSPKHPYFLPFQHCVIKAAEIVPDDQQVFITMDRHDHYADRAIRLYNQLLEMPLQSRPKLGDVLTFAGKNNLPGLQAADLYAHRARVFTKGFKRGSPNDADRDSASWFADIEPGMGVLTLDVLDKLLQGCPFRSSFWEGLSEPDFLEDIRRQGTEVVCYKNADPETYLTHYLDRTKVKIVAQVRKELQEDGTECFALWTPPNTDLPPYINQMSHTSHMSELSHGSDGRLEKSPDAGG